jgi:hypothetical protein
MSINSFLSCPADCDTTFTLPAIAADQDCTTVTFNYSQVCGIYFVLVDADDPLTWTDPAAPTATAGAIDNTNTDGTKVKYLVGRGGMAAPEKTELSVFKRKTKVVNRRFTLTLTVDNMTDANYEFLRKLQCGDTSGTFYFEDVADFIYGPEGGITPRSVDVDFIHGEGDDDVQSAQVIIVFDSNDGNPPRFSNPLS